MLINEEEDSLFFNCEILLAQTNKNTEQKKIKFQKRKKELCKEDGKQRHCEKRRKRIRILRGDENKKPHKSENIVEKYVNKDVVAILRN